MDVVLTLGTQSYTNSHCVVNQALSAMTIQRQPTMLLPQNAVNIAAHTYACRKRLHEITQQLHIHSTAVDFGEQHSRDADLICDPGAASLSTLAIAMSSDSGHHCEQQSLQLWSGH